jgi:hypothetical protein
MKFFRYTAVMILVTVMLAGCNTLSSAPGLHNARIEPAVLHPGDTAVITLKVKDRHALVDRVEGIVTDEPRIEFQLRDDGEGGDVKAGDGVWTLKVDVPFQAPPGDFLLEFTAYRSDGLPVPVRDGKGNVIALTTSLPVSIRYEDQT